MKTRSDLASLPLDKQLNSAFNQTKNNNILFSISFRIFLGFFLILNILIKTFSEKIDLLNYLPLISIVALYIIINTAARIKVSFAITYTNLIGFFIPIFETLLITIATGFFNPQNPYLIFFGSEHIIYAWIIVLAALHGSRLQVIFTSFFVAIAHFTLSVYKYDQSFLREFGSTSLMRIINYQEFFWFSVYYVFMGFLLSRKTIEISSIDDDIKNIWIPKIVGGAYQDVMSIDNFFENQNYSVFSVTQMPEKFVGSDFYRIESYGDMVSIVIGDITSHGLNVSQGALMALSAFLATDHKDPATILHRINNVLYPVKREHGGETLAMSFLLKPNGEIIYNGILDKITILRHSKQQESILDIQETVETEGFILGKEKEVKLPKNKTIQLFDGDNLVILTDGAANNDLEDDRTSVVITYHSS